MLQLSLIYIFHVLYIFSIALIVFEKFEEKVYEMEHCRALDGFFKHNGDNLTLLLLLPLLQYLEFSPFLRISARLLRWNVLYFIKCITNFFGNYQS